MAEIRSLPFDEEAIASADPELLAQYIRHLLVALKRRFEAVPEKETDEVITGLWKFGNGNNYITFEKDGTLRMNGTATVFEDLQVSISNVRIPTSNAPTWRLYNHGIGAGVTFPVLGFALNELIYFDVQTHHAMKISTVLSEHIHYMTPSDGTGDKFKFQLDVIAAPLDGTWAVPTGSPFTKEVSMTTDLSNTHKLEEIAAIPAVNTTVSTLYKCKLTRIAASANEFAGEMYLEFTDGHYEKDTMGSRLKDVK